jgi:hypothetical protein
LDGAQRGDEIGVGGSRDGAGGSGHGVIIA